MVVCFYLFGAITLFSWSEGYKLDTYHFGCPNPILTATVQFRLSGRFRRPANLEVLWMDEIRSHHFEAMVEAMVRWYLQKNDQKPGFLKWISTPSTVSRLPLIWRVTLQSRWFCDVSLKDPKKLPCVVVVLGGPLFEASELSA